MPQVVVGLDLHLKRTHGTVMTMDGKIVKQERFNTDREELKEFLKGVPKRTKVALESLGFYWPWIDLIEELDHIPLLANPIKVKQRAEDVKTDKVDSELLAHLTHMDWLPTCYVPDREMRWLRNLRRHPQMHFGMVVPANHHRHLSKTDLDLARMIRPCYYLWLLSPHVRGTQNFTSRSLNAKNKSSPHGFWRSAGDLFGSLTLATLNQPRTLLSILRRTGRSSGRPRC